jgi:hypothetical protein
MVTKIKRLTSQIKMFCMVRNRLNDPRGSDEPKPITLRVVLILFL